MIDVPSRLGEYTFCPRECVKGADRDFPVMLYSDGTLRWVDKTKRNDVIGHEEGLLLAMFDGEDQVVSDRGQQFVVTTEASIGVRSMFARIGTIEAAGKFLAARTVAPLDRHLEEIFWVDVNPQLPDPLTRKATGRNPKK
jgi:hypothetical protein